MKVIRKQARIWTKKWKMYENERQNDVNDDFPPPLGVFHKQAKAEVTF